MSKKDSTTKQLRKLSPEALELDHFFYCKARLDLIPLKVHFRSNNKIARPSLLHAKLLDIFT